MDIVATDSDCVSALGGFKATSEIVGVTFQAVWYWIHPAPGCIGGIPAERRLALYAEMRRRGMLVSPHFLEHALLSRPAPLGSRRKKKQAQPTPPSDPLVPPVQIARAIPVPVPPAKPKSSWRRKKYGYTRPGEGAVRKWRKRK